mmetsp:Transcript_3295/g.10029  ORF Transcript_3295/g.10029 Transcript_3295/m.10029 type:complete len:181 (+) Transcript_3295:323-865(+)
MRQGAVWRETRLYFGHAWSETLTVSNFDPLKSYTVTNSQIGLEFNAEFAFERTDKGCTKVAMTLDGHTAGRMRWATSLMNWAIGWFVKPLLQAALRDVLAKDLRDMQAALEQTHGCKQLRIAGEERALQIGRESRPQLLATVGAAETSSATAVQVPAMLGKALTGKVLAQHLPRGQVSVA